MLLLFICFDVNCSLYTLLQVRLPIYVCVKADGSDVSAITLKHVSKDIEILYLCISKVLFQWIKPKYTCQ
jgi:hypothetical protein